MLRYYHIDTHRYDEEVEMVENTELRETVRRRYAASAVAVEQGCCAPTSTDVTGAQYSSRELDSLPDAAAAASLGCGNPTAVAELREGETVLDLGSGGGIDVILSARRVGSTGFAYGLDMTDEMLELARRNAAEAGIDNVEFLRGYMEQIPLDDATVDVVISNCVINLSVDKPAVFAEIFRVLKPGGRIGITDIVADDRLSPEDRAERGSWVGCIAGALSVSEYTGGLNDAGFMDVSLTATHTAADGLDSMIVRAHKPR
jgi:SAM-dependent methyltransferase